MPKLDSSIFNSINLISLVHELFEPPPPPRTRFPFTDSLQSQKMDSDLRVLLHIYLDTEFQTGYFEKKIYSKFR